MTTTINASPTNGLVQTADGSGVLKVQSNGIATNALAWVNFNGTGTVAIRSSYNVSSITDNGTGDYTVNFTTAMSDANYAKVTGASTTSSNVPQGCFVDYSRVNNALSAPTTGYFRISIAEMSGAFSAVDTAYISVAVFGN